jgi:hypothetical protein
LDAACGTGAYLVEVLNTIANTLKSKDDDPLTAQKMKHFAMEHVFGFEVLPAPFVISHLQLGLLLQQLGAPLSESNDERVGVYLTNSLKRLKLLGERIHTSFEQTFPSLSARFSTTKLRRRYAADTRRE